MKVKYVEIENLLSIGRVRLDFDDRGMVLMDGHNHDDDTANGAGKSAVFIGIPFAIWEKFPRKITKSEILRKGTKKGYSKVGIEIGPDLLEVKRSRPSKVEFFENGNPIEMNQEEFEKKIGLSYNQFLICMYSAQSEGKKLINISDREKKDFILKLMDLEKFGLKKKEVDTILKDLYSKRTDEEKDIAVYESKLEVYNEQMIDEVSVQAEIARLDYSDLDKKIAKLKKVRKPDTSKYIELKKKVAEKRSKLDSQFRDAALVSAKLESAKKELAEIDDHSITCPECDTDIVPGASVVDRKKTLKKRIKTFDDKRKTYPDFKKMQRELDEILEKSTKAQKRDEQGFLDAQQTVVQAMSLRSTRKIKIDGLKKQINESRSRIRKITKLESDIQKVNKKLEALNKDIEVWETVSMTLSPMGAPAYIMDAVLDVFNEKVSEYTAEIWPSASYRIQSFKENKDKEVKAKFSDKLVINGRDRSIGSLSGGEHKCLSLAVDLAIIDVIESMFGNVLNPIILDEPYEGLDASNRERAIAMLEKKAQRCQIWVIDHASEAKAMFSKIVRIEKQNGISSLVI